MYHPNTDILENKQHIKISSSCNDPQDLLREALWEMTLHAREMENTLFELKNKANKIERMDWGDIGG